ncbi:hypothetical protein KY310_00655 [Candidatus Woesearchaeota archaeon]|nr:hypothetical protein [Candidatus Woesearchaeota archaeon]
MTEDKEKKNLSFADKLQKKIRKKIGLVTALGAIHASMTQTGHAQPVEERQDPKVSGLPDAPYELVRLTEAYRTAREAMRCFYATDPEAPKPAWALDVHESICELEQELQTSNAAAGGLPPQDVIAKLRAYRLAVIDAAAEDAQKAKNYRLPEKDENCGVFKGMKFGKTVKEHTKGEYKKGE